VGKLINLARKGGWNLADQILSALSNVMLSVVVANSVDRSGFGSFAMAFVVFGIGIAVTRAVVGQPYQIRYASRDEETQRRATRRSHGFAVLLGLAAGIGCIVAGAVLPGTMGAAFLALGVSFPALLLQDCQRLTFMASERRWGAVVVDGARNVALFGGLWIAWATGPRDVPLVVPSTTGRPATLRDKMGGVGTIEPTDGRYVLSLPGASADQGAFPGDYFIGGDPYVIVESVP